MIEDERFDVKIKELYKKSILNNYPHELPLHRGGGNRLVISSPPMQGEVGGSSL